MIKQKGQEGNACGGGDARVSRALWPVNARRAVATDRIVQRRRQLILMLKSQWWMWLLVGAGITAAVAAHLWLLFLLALAFLSAMLLLLRIIATRASHSSATKRLLGARHRLQEWKSFPGKLGETPVPVALVRVLETVDLSQTDVELRDTYWSSTGLTPASPRLMPASSLTPTRGVK